MIGRIVNNYEIRALVGEGTVGTVYLCEHTFITRKVTLEVLRPMDCEDDDRVARCLGEARAANAIGHPNIIALVDVGRLDDGQPYLMTEYLEGESLAARLRRSGRLPLNEALGIARQATQALAAAHAAGIVHGHLRPENLFLSGDAMRGIELKLLDFGVSKLQQETADAPDARADVYALGGLLYEVLCGEPPFAGASAAQGALRSLTGTPLPPRGLNPELPAWIEPILLQALAEEPEQRFASMDALAAALQAGPPARAASNPALTAVEGEKEEAATKASPASASAESGNAASSEGAAGDPAESASDASAESVSSLAAQAARILDRDRPPSAAANTASQAEEAAAADAPALRFDKTTVGIPVPARQTAAADAPALRFDKTTVGIPVPPQLSLAGAAVAHPVGSSPAPAPPWSSAAAPASPAVWDSAAPAPQPSSAAPASISARPFSHMLTPPRRCWLGPGLGGAALLTLLFVWAPWSPEPAHPPAPLPQVSADRAMTTTPPAPAPSAAKPTAPAAPSGKSVTATSITAPIPSPTSPRPAAARPAERPPAPPPAPAAKAAAGAAAPTEPPTATGRRRVRKVTEGARAFDPLPATPAAAPAMDKW